MITCSVLEVSEKGITDIISCINKPNYRAKYRDYLRLSKIDQVHNIMKEAIKFRKLKSEVANISHFVITFSLEKLQDKLNRNGTPCYKVFFLYKSNLDAE